MSLPIALLTALLAQSSGGGLFMAGLELEVTAQTRLEPGAPVRVRAVMAPARAQQTLLLKRYPDARAPEGLTWAGVRGYPSGKDAPAARHRQSSFVVDFAEPAVLKLRPLVEQRAGKKPSLEALTAFVDQFITRKRFTRGFDLASQVAQSQEGDCSEHAVLLTALARMFGHPARVVVGAVVFQPPKGPPVAAGHAWTEVWMRKGGWQVQDAALWSEGKAAPAIYLPMGVLEDEGPGFALGLMQATSAMEVKKLVLEDAVAIPHDGRLP
jgi:transglutaminase-like putative cysteine protease